MGAQRFGREERGVGREDDRPPRLFDERAIERGADVIDACIEKLASSQFFPKTSQPANGDFRRAFDRHLRRGFNGQPTVQMQGPPGWKGIYDDHRRLMVIANYNMDTGDAWEHADDPNYPLPMTAFAYQMGTNYVLYALTH